MQKETYEDNYKNLKHFSFGKNWQDFLKSLNDERIENAKKSLVDFLGGEEKIKGKTFVDIGCGSGLFSLAAYKLGAAKVVSVDVDEFSISCAKYLGEKEGNPENWEIKQGSALDENFIRSLGQFDIVYSWGVLHHTGDMYSALKNVSSLINPEGVFYLAIYNRNKNRLKEGTSNLWLMLKKAYNESNFLVKKVMEYVYIAYFFIGLLVMLKNPLKYIREYKSNRGMNWRNDIIDWLGGYPYEFAGPDEIINFFGKRKLLCKKLTYREGTGCSEYLLKRST